MQKLRDFSLKFDRRKIERLSRAIDKKYFLIFRKTTFALRENLNVKNQFQKELRLRYFKLKIR